MKNTQTSASMLSCITMPTGDWPIQDSTADAQCHGIQSKHQWPGEGLIAERMNNLRLIDNLARLALQTQQS
jgi:hypothetical protein